MPTTNSVTETPKIMHTPGPWTCHVVVSTPYIGDPAEKRIACEYALNKQGNGVRIVTQDEAYANARLIAAAPELLEACALFTAAAHEVRDVLNGHGFASPASIAFAAEKARNAIAKAEGR